MKQIILLDLNYTLVGNSEKKRAPFIEQIKLETYRMDLIELVRPHYVILITARPVKYQAPTLGSIAQKTGWKPQEYFFNDTNLAPQWFKRSVVINRLTKFHSEQMIAIESNPKTINEYKKMGILCLSVQ